MNEVQNEPTVFTRSVRVDPNSLREIAYLGVRRAAAFLSIGMTTTERYVPESLSLDNHSMWHFFPDPLPGGAGEQAVSEFRSWLIGNALRELDLHFSLFLDNASFLTRLSVLHGKRVRTDHIIRTISDDTNAARKYETVMKELGEEAPDSVMLDSLSRARNCLTHNLGVVRQRDTNADGTLSLKWLGIEGRLVQGEHMMVLPPIFDRQQAPDPSKEAFVEIAIVEREKRFEVRQKITLGANDLHEICFYYMRSADQIIEKFMAHLAELGVSADVPNTDTPQRNT